MPKVRASSTRMGTTRGPRSLVAQQLGQEAHEAWVVDLAAFGRGLEHGLEGVQRGTVNARRPSRRAVRR